MMKRTSLSAYKMKLGKMYVDYKLQSRDTEKHIQVEEAQIDPSRTHCVAPLSWLQALRSPTKRMPTGYYTEETIHVPPPTRHDRFVSSSTSMAGGVNSSSICSTSTAPGLTGTELHNAVRAGPLVMHILGMPTPVVVNMDFVEESEWGFATHDNNSNSSNNLDLRIGMEAIEQCPLFHELRPGGLLSNQSLRTLKSEGLMQVDEVAESPLARRPWTRMKTMFIDELQRGPTQNEYVGFNPKNSRQWRFSQYYKDFRVGIFKETTRTKDLVEGLHSHSSYQRSPQQAVPEVRHVAPGP